jgi:hypothetical protein
MTAMNVVHMRVKPGKETEFLALNSAESSPTMKGMRDIWVIKTGDRSYCLVGKWDSMEALAAARPAMIGQLDKMRDLLEDLGGGRGVTEPYSGTVVSEASF